MKTTNLDLKMMIIKVHNRGKKVNIIAQEKGLSHSTISNILKDKDRIREVIKWAPGMASVLKMAHAWNCLYILAWTSNTEEESNFF